MASRVSLYVGNVPITKGDKQTVRKPWERNNATTSSNSDEDQGNDKAKKEEKEKEKEKEQEQEQEKSDKDGDHAQEVVDHSSEVEVHTPPTHV